MQVSVPTSRFSILGTAKLKSISRRKSTKDPSAAPSRPESIASLRNYSWSDDRPAETEEHSDGTRLAASRSQPHERSAKPARHRATNRDSREVDPKRFSFVEGAVEPEIHAPARHPRWIESDTQTSSADCEKEAYITQQQMASEPGADEETMKEVRREAEPFKGLADYQLDLGKSRKLIDDDYLRDVFGITMSRRSSEDNGNREKPSGDDLVIPPLPSSEEMAAPGADNTDLFEMEVPLALDPRPQDHVEQRKGSLAEIHSMDHDSKIVCDSQELSSTESSSSTARQAQMAQQLQEESTTTVALLSPDQVVESPKPRRPFSTLSIDGMSGTHLKESAGEMAMKSAISASSAETGGPDGKSSEHSLRSSMSSVASSQVSQKVINGQMVPAPRERPRKSPSEIAARREITSMYHDSLAPSRESHSAASMRNSNESHRVRRQASDSSIRSNSQLNNYNVNKPLPPEPGRSRRLSHISEKSTPSRASSITIRQSHYAARKAEEENVPPLPTAPVPESVRASMLSGVSLRSKYAPKDLDSLEDALAKRDPSRKAQTAHMNSYQNSKPTTEATTTSERKASISGETPRQQENSSRKNSVYKAPTPADQDASSKEKSKAQPNDAPARRSNLLELMIDKPASRLKGVGRSPSSRVGSSQTKDAKDPTPQRSATVSVGGSSNKAHLILGKPVSGTPSIQENRYEADWSRSGSPEPQEATPSSSRSGADSPDDFEIPQDAHFEEIRRRMELLSAKDDPSTTFLSIHARNVISMGGMAPEIPHRRTHKPTLSTHVEQPESTQIAELEAMSIKRESMKREHETRRQSENGPAELEGCEPGFRAELPLVGSSPRASLEQFVPPTPPPPPFVEKAPSFDHHKRNDGMAVLPSSRKRESASSSRPAQPRSVPSQATSEIQGTNPRSAVNAVKPQKPSSNLADRGRVVFADPAERVLFHILWNLDNLKDLFAVASASRGFYRTFKNHKSRLIRHMVWCMSPAAWEFREITSDGTETTLRSYLTDYAQDTRTLANLKALILEHCESFLRSETIEALADESESSSRIDDACWRVWTFCKIFGCGSGREYDITGQMDWLKGGKLAKQSAATKSMVLSDDMMKNSILYDPPEAFAEGNGDGLSADELYDMTEIWNCLAVLVRGYHEKRDQGRKYGVFDKIHVPKGDMEKENAVLEEWTYYLLTQGPNVVLKAASPSSPTSETFSRTRTQGFTNWVPPPAGSSRSTFLKEALSRVYDEETQKTRALANGSPKGFSSLPQVVGVENSAQTQNLAHSRQRIMAHQAELRAKKEDPSYKDAPIAEDRPMSNFSDVLARLENVGEEAARDAPPVPTIQRITSRMARKQKSTDAAEAKRKPSEDGNSSPAPSTGSNPASPMTLKARKSRALAGIRNKVTGRSQLSIPESNGKQGTEGDKTKGSEVSLHSYSSKISVDAASVSTRSTLASRGSAETGEHVYAPMVDKLTALGFTEGKARRALESHTRGNFIDFEEALTELAKQREHKQKMQRLARMG